MPPRDLNRVEATPGNSHHADVTVGPRLLGKPIDYLKAILLFLVGVFAVGRISFTRARAANVHTRGNVATFYEIRMELPITRQGPIVFAVRQIFQDRWEFFAVLGVRRGWLDRSAWHVKIHG